MLATAVSYRSDERRDTVVTAQRRRWRAIAPSTCPVQLVLGLALGAATYTYSTFGFETVRLAEDGPFLEAGPTIASSLVPRSCPLAQSATSVSSAEIPLGCRGQSSIASIPSLFGCFGHAYTRVLGHLRWGRFPAHDLLVGPHRLGAPA